MSDRFAAPHGQSPIVDPKRSALPRRIFVYAGLALAGLIVLAWIDAGEEPLRPIIHRIASPLAQGTGQ